jgi:hypothetical protein
LGLVEGRIESAEKGGVHGVAVVKAITGTDVPFIHLIVAVVVNGIAEFDIAKKAAGIVVVTIWASKTPVAMAIAIRIGDASVAGIAAGAAPSI